MLSRLKKRLETGILVAALVLPLTLCVFLFLGLAVYLSLRETLPPDLAALVTAACGVLMIALILVLARLVSAAPRNAGSRSRGSGAGSTAPGAGTSGAETPTGAVEHELREQLDPLLGEWVRKYPARTALATLALGIAAGYSRPIRTLLMDTASRYSESEAVRRSQQESSARD